MIIPNNMRIATVTKILLALVAAMTVLSFILGSIVIAQNIESGWFDKLSTLVHVDMERNFPTWVSSILLFLVGLHFLLIAYCGRVIRKRYFAHWLILAFIFFGLSADEFIQFHEQIIKPIRNLFDTGGYLYYPWIVPAAILTVVVGLMYIGFIHDLQWETRRLFILAGLVYVVGALGVEAIGGNYFDTVIRLRDYKPDLIYLFLTHTEEFMELAGTVLFLHFGMRYLKMILEPEVDTET